MLDKLQTCSYNKVVNSKYRVFNKQKKPSAERVEDERRMKVMIYTVFFTEEDSTRMPHDCESYKEAVEYAEEKGGNYVIVSTVGNVE